MPKRTRPFRDLLLESLSEPETAAAYLTEALRSSPETFRKALRNVAQSRQMTKVARDAGVTREGLYRATSDVGNPTLDTLESVLGVMDLKLIVVPNTEATFRPLTANVIQCAELDIQTEKTSGCIGIIGNVASVGVNNYQSNTSQSGAVKQYPFYIGGAVPSADEVLPMAIQEVQRRPTVMGSIVNLLAQQAAESESRQLCEI
jgi:probable addiction module antidote protein